MSGRLADETNIAGVSLADHFLLSFLIPELMRTGAIDPARTAVVFQAAIARFEQGPGPEHKSAARELRRLADLFSPKAPPTAPT